MFQGKGVANVRLLKDCGLVPYFMHKNHNAEAVIITADFGNYTYLNTYVQGLKLHFLDLNNGTVEGNILKKVEYLKANYEDIDCLIFHGPYDENLYVGNVYKRLKPEGKIYMALDANSGWMDRIDFCAPLFYGFMEQCDVIATSCRAMQRHLNEKWPWKIEYISNGYFDYYSYHGYNYTFDFSEKENIILTVGRNGTDQKCTDVLLEGFALIADKIPDWKLKIVGSVEKSFENYICDYFIKYPELSTRVIFCGNIIDKIKLFNEYAKAKVFALSSYWEGGTPNVISEALFNGDAIVIRNVVDAYNDAIDDGQCGTAANDLSVQSFAKALSDLCLSDELEQKCKHAHKYARQNFDMSKNVDRIYEMLFGEV